MADGDTITVMRDGKGVKIRLYAVDTPEKGQAFGQKATEVAKSMVAGREVFVEQKDIDRYRRVVGLVTVNGTNLNELLVHNGYAWVYRQYCKENFCTSWIQAEQEAKQQKKGMWSDPHIIPPWECHPPDAKTCASFQFCHR